MSASSTSSQEPLKVIFLDIDGVLLPFPQTTPNPSGRLFPDETLEALSRLLKHTQAKLVLSSTWRVRDDFCYDILECLEKYADEQGQPNHILHGYSEQFWSKTDVNLHSERQWEIHAWLQTYTCQSDHHNFNQKIVWLALDDEELIIEDKNQEHRKVFEGHVVKTTSSVGLTMEDVNLGIQLWNKQLENL
jgi:hypothetical protein